MPIPEHIFEKNANLLNLKLDSRKINEIKQALFDYNKLKGME